MTTRLTIGRLANEVGVAPGTVRFYEAEGLLPPADRTEAGYRVYSQEDVRRLRLIKKARALGLGLPEIRELTRHLFELSCNDYEEGLDLIISRHVEETRRKIEVLRRLEEELVQLRTQLHEVAAPAGCRVSDCECCPLLDDDFETGSRACPPVGGERPGC